MAAVPAAKSAPATAAGSVIWNIAVPHSPPAVHHGGVTAPVNTAYSLGAAPGYASGGTGSGIGPRPEVTPGLARGTPKVSSISGKSSSTSHLRAPLSTASSL